MKNAVLERNLFWSRDQWVTDLRTRASTCEFGAQKDHLIRDKIVFGTRDELVKERLFREPNLTLETAMDICRGAEASRYQAKVMAKDSTRLEVQVVAKGQRQRFPAVTLHTLRPHTLHEAVQPMGQPAHIAISEITLQVSA